MYIKCLKTQATMRTICFSLMCYTLVVTISKGQTPTLSPDQDKNYVITITPVVGDIQEQTQLPYKPVEEVNQTIQYFDGLGRPVQTVNAQGSPTKNDVVLPYLPYTSSTTPGSFKVNALYDTDSYISGEQYLFYQNTSNIAHDVKPFSESILESSPLDRINKQGAPGADWQPQVADQNDRSIETIYSVNAENEVLLFDYDEVTSNMIFSSLTYYAPNKLYMVKTLDEHKHEVVEYTDKEGRTVLKKVEYKEENGTKLYAETYYIYDDFGNLVVVLPPEAVAAIKSSFSSN
jgi:hypothetical protein